MNKGNYLFTSESVTEGHPDKMCDQISDAILDEILSKDSSARVACETLISNGICIISGEITTTTYANIQNIVRNTIKNIGYNNSEYGFDYKNCAVMNMIGEQSPDINQGVDLKNGEIGAGDQGLMFGYACNETPELMPLPIMLAHKLVKRLSEVRKLNIIENLRPDGKSQVTVEYDENNIPISIHSVVLSTQHDDIDSLEYERMKDDIIEKVILEILPNDLVNEDLKIYINPTGRFVIGGPKGDTGLTGRKIIVDTYGGSCPHGGGAFCFSGDTLVKTIDGYKQIDKITKGDFIWTMNEKNNRLECKEVNDVNINSLNDSENMVLVELENGEQIKVTENHEFYSKTESIWKPIIEFYEGEELEYFENLKPSYSHNSIHNKIKKITKINKEQTYDLNIKDNHNYFVSNSNILVHNSGKDPSKVDRSASYMARYIAKNLVATKLMDRVTIQLSYAIGMINPISITVDTHNTSKVTNNKIIEVIKKVFNLTPKGIIESLDLLNQNYTKTAAYGHFGNKDYSWEALNKVEELKRILEK